MTYFLEKFFTYNNSMKLIPASHGYKAIVRPCKWDYSAVMKFFAGKMPRNKTLMLGGCVATLDINKDSSNSLERWLISLALEKNIQPDFEEWHLMSYAGFDDYIVKTIDLHTNAVIDDRIDKIVN